jgi:hypothetical protein
MCLEIKKGQRVKIAKEDITCYKVLLCKDKSWYTFYKRMKIHPGSICRSDITILKSDFYSTIYEALHSFTSLGVANDFVYCRVKPSSSIIVECIIPKGAKYYIGTFEDSDDSYASDTLVYPEEF